MLNQGSLQGWPTALALRCFRCAAPPPIRLLHKECDPLLLGARRALNRSPAQHSLFFSSDISATTIVRRKYLREGSPTYDTSEVPPGVGGNYGVRQLSRTRPAVKHLYMLPSQQTTGGPNGALSFSTTSVQHESTTNSIVRNNYGGDSLSPVQTGGCEEGRRRTGNLSSTPV